ncbi:MULTISPECIES: 30S ribosomal protein S7 [Pseudothermotoga]|jgi:small subunit ribosomal protein S7|uniref:Small ribosomal subunit protein uS7 n=1 Tax=Pseudothermotoga lettingae (strain ATCC BAA-301 / DSM 14385 / NBRC 107922 / TMO) TaxID=416591 RepID=RS7_PSELT|nr:MULTISPECIES: 30S ribosomal protein S7 [Pseudothermotoga]A8F4Q7.1 RecName: Full=Small ribosomal subunit protein uS7; AltName: Full=30S ribosomal protein S7 [Pseudothermotoga lettingae TMO]ABV33141.1 ribosomal protein S7 [Pseudothermotoga lettingae TMO]KUK21632.1 MAG: 30S ribosomal protein S7 [Pseudothermotoga lettingae]MDI3494408.1 small subunit ribosomal protein [Pseudothermotoga sp.]MDK2884147.1 small subunit ribosomal protein [Pseudothermotoga sp.]GLI47857.1 30S ribosomal protein S7 [Ps
MRRRRAEVRKIAPDPVYSDILVAKLVNRIMWDGKKAVAQKIVYRSFEYIQEKSGKDPLEVFQKAIENVRPVLEVRPRRVGGATYQVPVEVQEPRKTSLALRWIVAAARAKKGKPMYVRLAEEILASYQGTGTAMKKKEDVHKMAEANRAFAHLRW